MAKVVSQTPVLTSLNSPTPNQIFNMGLKMAEEIDAVNKQKGIHSDLAAEWIIKYTKMFGGSKQVKPKFGKKEA